MTDAEKWVFLRNRTLHQGFCTVKSVDLRFRRHDGKWSDVVTREYIDKPGAVGVLPLDLKRKKVILIRQFRIGGIITGELEQWPWEIVAGIKDHLQESALMTAQRELQEETGLKSEKIVPFMSYFTAPGYTTEKIELFYALIDSEKAAKYAGLAAENEDIIVDRISFAEVGEALKQGKIINGMTLIALEWLMLHKNEL